VIKHSFGLRGLFTSVVVIALTAGAAAAAGPSQHGQGLATAADKAGKTVPVAAPAAQGAGDEAGTPEEQLEAAPAADPQTSDHCATDPTTLDEAGLAALNHGAIVCWAAHQATPPDAKNHGEFVSTWAKDNHGHETSQAARDAHGKPEGAGKPAGAGNH
jgi:hypothetical protein